MKRPRWHDFIIVFSILALFGAGVGALWGGAIRDAVEGLMDSDQEPSQPPQTAQPPGPAHKDLL